MTLDPPRSLTHQGAEMGESLLGNERVGAEVKFPAALDERKPEIQVLGEALRPGCRPQVAERRESRELAVPAEPDGAEMASCDLDNCFCSALDSEWSGQLMLSSATR